MKTKPVIVRPATRNEWLEIRRQGIGSSEVGTILCLNPWETPYQLWRRKVGIDPAKEENFAMKAGHYLEEAVAKFFADATGAKIIRRSCGDWIVRHPELSFLQASPDRLYWEAGARCNRDNKRILECKTTQAKIDPDHLPEHWVAQLTYQMGIFGAKRGALAWLTAGREFGYQEIAFDPDFFEFIVAEVTRFWHDNVLGGVEPMSVSADDVLIRNPRHTPGKTIVADNDLADTIHNLAQVKVSISALTERKERLEDTIKLAMGDAEAVSDGGAKALVTWRAGKDREQFDYRGLRADHPELCAPYIHTVPGARTFLVK